MDANAIKKDDKRSIIAKWTFANIYRAKKWDSILYFILYIVIPVIITMISVNTIGDTDFVTAAYFFLTTGITALGCIYDVAGRWDGEGDRIKNLKLFIMGVPMIFIVIYCFYQLVYSLILCKVNMESIWIFYFYLLPMIICLYDICFCFVIDIMKKSDKEDKK